MSDCCRDQEPKLQKPARKLRVANCPACEVRGKPVAARLLKHQVNSVLLDSVSESEAYMFCATPNCDVVYFTAEGRQIHTHDVRLPVTQKATGHERPLCYCFGFTEGMLRQELEHTGHTTIPERINAEIKAGNCACEIRNPQGSCCLGNVSTVLRSSIELLGFVGQSDSL